jgi:uncharacterized protein involved in response to NO
VFYGEISITTAFTPRDWHVHETLFGYVAAVVTGFLLTAIPNWSGRLPIQRALDLGLVYGAPQTAARIEVALTMTSRYCPLGEMLIEGGEGSLARALRRRAPARRGTGTWKVMMSIPRLRSYAFHPVELVWSPPWSVDRMSEEGRCARRGSANQKVDRPACSG